MFGRRGVENDGGLHDRLRALNARPDHRPDDPPVAMPNSAPAKARKWALRASRGVGRALSGLFRVRFVWHPGAPQGCAPGYRIRPFQGRANAAH